MTNLPMDRLRFDKDRALIISHLRQKYNINLEDFSTSETLVQKKDRFTTLNMYGNFQAKVVDPDQTIPPENDG